MKTLSKTLLASALFTAGVTGFTTAQAVEWSLGGELAVELTDAESSDDLGLEVTTTDFVITVSETFGEVEVEGYQAFTKGSTAALDRDGAGISVSGAFGSVFVGDDGTGVLAADLTDVMYNNSEYYFKDDTTNVIDYGLPLGDDFSLNLFVDITDTVDDSATAGTDEDAEQDEDIDAFGFYGSYSLAGATFLFGYTDYAADGAYGEDEVLDLAAGYEFGPVALGVGFQDSDAAVDEIISGFVSYTAGPVVVTGYAEDAGDQGDLVALNVTYSFSDNFYAFFETAAYDDDTSDNTEVGLVLTF